MKPRSLFVVAVSIVALVALAGLPYARAADPEVLGDYWDEIRINDGPAGHGHSVVRRTGTAEAPLIEMSVTSHMELKRGPSTMVIDRVVVTTERPDGSLVTLRDSVTSTGVETLKEVKFEDGKAKLATTAMGQRRESSLDVPAGTVGPFKAERVPIEAGLKSGSKHEIKIFALDVGGAQVQTVTVGEMEEVETLAGKQKLTRTVRQIGPMPPETVWVDAEGRTIVMQVTMMGMRIQTRRGTKEQVLSKKDGAEVGADLLEASFLKTKHLIPHARSTDAALLHVRAKNPDVKLTDLEDDRQKIESREADGSLLLRVRRVVPAAGATGKRPLAAPPLEIATYLAATSMLQADDPLIRTSAEEAVGTETDAWKAAQAIERWVERAISDKNFGVGFGSALEVCKSRSGDCTEHAVLAAALCRAVGIPARVVFGLEYLDGIFGGHAWTEVWIEGRWYAFDATLGTGSADALHLSLGRLALAEGAEGAEMMAFINLMGGLEVDVREVTWEGKTLRLDAAAATVDGTRYVDRLWGLAIEAPSGYAVNARKPFAGMSDRLVELEGKTDAGKRGLEVDAQALLPGQTLVGALRNHKGTRKDITIDGRPGILIEGSRGTKRRLAAFVLDDGDSLFSFEIQPFEGEADAALLTTVLKTVDLDAEVGVK